jgi:transcriptional regulator with XRE-family HTH domain
MPDAGARIRQKIKEMGITQAELARRVGIAPQNLQDILDGKVKRTKHVPAIASALGVDVTWLTSGKQASKPSLELEALRQAVTQLGKDAEGFREDAQFLRQQLAASLEENRRLRDRIVELERGRGAASA